MKKFFSIICAATLILAGCGENSQATPAEVKEEIPVKNSITIQVNGKNFSATLEDNPTARAFEKIIPLELDMAELNGNEKYFYLDEYLPSNPVNLRQIHPGDLMLFGSNCLVIFYENFATDYSYTRIGTIDNPADLEKILGSGNVLVKFSKN